MKKVLVPGLIAGLILFIVSYGGLFLSIRFFPEFFVTYNNPLFNSDGSRDILKGLLTGPFLLRVLEFGFIYAIVALLPVMWITFSSLDITFIMVMSWFLYGFFQAVLAGIVFARLNP
jgi:hypothetical protein